MNPRRRGGHSLKALAPEYGEVKVENEDWSKYTDHMLSRCVSDVEITRKLYLDLMVKANLSREGILNR